MIVNAKMLKISKPSDVAEGPLAFSNPEYMCFSELRSLLDVEASKTSQIEKPATATLTRKSHRLVPLPPPPQRPPPPPPSRLYQNLDQLDQPLHVDCNSGLTTSRRFEGLNKINSNLIKIVDMNNESTCSSLVLLSTSTHYNSSATSDSSTATMIIKNSPPAPSSDLRSKYIMGALSPIMTSSRADLKEFRQVCLNDLNESHSFIVNKESVPPPVPPRPVLTHLTNSLPFNRNQMNRHQRQRRLSFDLNDFNTNETLQYMEAEQIDNTLVQKSFANQNYDPRCHRQLGNGSFTASTSSLSASSSLSSLILMPPSPFKTSASHLPKLATATPTKSNIKLIDHQPTNKQVKKVSFMLRQEGALLNTSDYEEADHLLARSLNRNSISSELSTSSSSLITSPADTMVFVNNDYFLNVHHIEPSSSSSSSTCSSSSSSSSGYKSNHSAFSTNKLSPTDLSIFIQSNQERLERLRKKRAELVKNTNQLSEMLDSEFQEEVKVTDTLSTPVRDQQGSHMDSAIIKNVSVKLFQTLLRTKTASNSNTPQMSAPVNSTIQSNLNTLPRRSHRQFVE